MPKSVETLGRLDPFRYEGLTKKQVAPYFQLAMDRWLEERRKLESGEIGPGAYEDWESRYMSQAQHSDDREEKTEKTEPAAPAKTKRKRRRRTKKN